MCEWGEDGVDSHEGVVVEGEDCVCPGVGVVEAAAGGTDEVDGECAAVIFAEF